MGAFPSFFHDFIARKQAVYLREFLTTVPPCHAIFAELSLTRLDCGRVFDRETAQTLMERLSQEFSNFDKEKVEADEEWNGFAERVEATRKTLEQLRP